MANPIPNLWRVPELKDKILFTLLMLLIYRVGAHITVPGLDVGALREQFGALQDTFLGIYDMFVGGGLSRATIFALGIMPYISASIILQLLTVVWPYLERLSKEGEAGRKKITQYTRYGTVVLSVIQSFGISLGLEGLQAPSGAMVVAGGGWGFRFMTVLTLTTGTAFIMWLGE
jgi:preprotein translocase subunit SecY